MVVGWVAVESSFAVVVVSLAVVEDSLDEVADNQCLFKSRKLINRFQYLTYERFILSGGA